MVSTKLFNSDGKFHMYRKNLNFGFYRKLFIFATR
jgi:hypothetical protein